MKTPMSEKMLQRSRSLRRNTTFCEQRLWNHLRARSYLGVKFRRQHVIGPYIVDFYCHEARLVIELDGGGHAESFQGNYDADRTLFLESHGMEVLRFWNNDVMDNIEGVMEVILLALKSALSLKERE